MTGRPAWATSDTARTGQGLLGLEHAVDDLHGHDRHGEQRRVKGGVVRGGRCVGVGGAQAWLERNPGRKPG